MKIKTFWMLFFKIIGIWLILSGLTLIPQFVTVFSFLGQQQNTGIAVIIFVIAISLLTVVVYLIILKLFVFNPGWIINKLKLERDFQEEKFDFNIALDSVLKIACIVVGALIIVDALPMMSKQLFTFIQQKNVFREDPEFGWLIFYSVKTFIGYLLMSNSKYIVKFIHKKTDNSDI
ncbi:MAG: hypothetical protein PF436_13925 [Prolixibacteraceae bacterium]|jgi:hypothetical protein|nr:hypothetical protein [Prolixibacteraceae bacterium]